MCLELFYSWIHVPSFKVVGAECTPFSVAVTMVTMVTCHVVISPPVAAAGQCEHWNAPREGAVAPPQ